MYITVLELEDKSFIIKYIYTNKDEAIQSLKDYKSFPGRMIIKCDRFNPNTGNISGEDIQIMDAEGISTTWPEKEESAAGILNYGFQGTNQKIIGEA